MIHARVQKGEVRTPPPEKSQVVIGFIRNAGTDPPREVLDPWVHLRLEVVRTASKTLILLV